MSVDLIALAAPIVFFAYAIFGITGFGAAMVSMPVLIQFMPLQFAVPLVVLFDLVCTALVGIRNWRHVSIPELKRLFMWMLIGIGLGVAVLHKANSGWPLVLLGCFVLVVCVRGLRTTGGHNKPMAACWAIPFGLVGGVFSAMFGTGGPVYTLYLSRRFSEMDAFRATISVVILLSGVIRAIAFGATGMYSQSGILLAALSLLPACLLGLFLGSRLRPRFSPENLRRCIYMLLAVAGVGAIYRGWVTPI